MRIIPGRLSVLFGLVSTCALAAAQDALPKEFSGASPLQWSVRLADAEMARRGERLNWRQGGPARWDYTAGLFTLALLKLDESVHDVRYVKFAENAIGSFIGPDGKIQTYRAEEYQLDALNPGKTALALWRRTHEERYQKAAAILRRQLETQPRTSDGGFWHKQRYEHQMWLDGLYMGAPFYAECARLFTEPATSFDDIAKQFRLIDTHIFDARTGLYYHGWDESKTQPWANPVTGTSSNFWGRAIGWYAMALVDTLDFFPTNHPARPELVASLQKVCRGVSKFQDASSGVWWQVMDQGARPGNYLEATASSMFVCAMAKGMNRGYLTREFAPVAVKGYRGLIEKFIKSESDSSWSLTPCCTVAGLGGSPSNGRARDGSFDYYIHEPVAKNDLKGVGPFILAGIEMQRLIDLPTSERVTQGTAWAGRQDRRAPVLGRSRLQIRTSAGKDSEAPDKREFSAEEYAVPPGRGTGRRGELARGIYAASTREVRKALEIQDALDRQTVKRHKRRAPAAGRDLQVASACDRTRALIDSHACWLT